MSRRALLLASAAASTGTRRAAARFVALVLALASRPACAPCATAAPYAPSALEAVRRVVEPRAARLPPGFPVVVTVSDGGECFARLRDNLLCQLRRFGIEAYVIFALDNRTLAELSARAEPVVALRGVRAAPAGVYEVGEYEQAVHAKVEAAYAVLLATGRDILFADADITLLRDPRPPLVSRAARLGADMQFQLDYPSLMLNSGLYHARANRRTLALMCAWLDALRSSRDALLDQPALNALARERCAANVSGPLSTRAARASDFAVRVRACDGIGAVTVESMPIHSYRTGSRHSLSLRLATPIVRRKAGGRVGVRGSVKVGGPFVLQPESELSEEEHRHVILIHANYILDATTKHHFLMHHPDARRGWCLANRTLCEDVGRAGGVHSRAHNYKPLRGPFWDGFVRR